MVSAHDVLDDAKLSKVVVQLPSRSKDELEADEREAREAAGIGSGDDDDDDDDDSDEGSNKNSADRRKERYLAVKASKLKMLESMHEEVGGEKDDDDFKVKEKDQRQREMEKLKRDIQGMKKGARAVKLGQETPGANKDVELLQGIEKIRAMHKSKKRVGAEREKDTMSKLKSFRTGTLKSLVGNEDAKEEQDEADFTHVGSYGWQQALDDYDDSDWLGVSPSRFKAVSLWL